MSRRLHMPVFRHQMLRAAAAALSMPGLIVRAEAPVPDIKAISAELQRVTAEFKSKGDELAKKAEDALKEVKDKGALLTETKAQVDKLLVEHTTLTGAKNKLESELSEAKARLLGVEQELVLQRDRAGGGSPKAHKTVGQQLIEDEGLKKFVAQGSSGLRGKYRFGVKAAITSLDFPVTQPSIVQPMTAPMLPRLVQRLFVRDLIPVGQTSAPAIFWVKQTGFTNNADVVSEGTVKPTSTIAYGSEMTPVTTIAHIFKASKQILDDFAMLRTDVDRELRYGLKYTEEREILFGDGTGIHLHGIVPQASAFAPEFQAEMHNRIDDIRLAMLQAQLARLPATGIVMHFIDWARIELTKDANGQYVFANPLRLAGNTLWGVPVVPTEINEFESHFLTGGFAGGAQIYDREEINVEVATENEDDFIRNLVAIRCEERLALAVPRPEAFIFGEFTAGSGT